MDEFKVGDLIEDNEGDKAVVRGVNPLKIEWDCRPGVLVTPHPAYIECFTNLSARVRELDIERSRRALN